MLIIIIKISILESQIKDNYLNNNQQTLTKLRGISTPKRLEVVSKANLASSVHLKRNK